MGEEKAVWKQLAREHPELSGATAIGLGVLECFAPGTPDVLSLKRLTEMLGVRSPSTLHPYTSLLTATGHLEQTPTRGYRLAAHANDVALAMLGSLESPRRARGALHRTREHTGHTTSLAVLDAGDVVYLDRLAGHRRGQHEVDDGIGIGTRLPALRTAAGKVLLAHLPPATRRSLITTLDLKRRGPNGIPTKSALHRELREIRQDGLAVSDEDLRDGLRSIAAPVVDEDGEVAAALEIGVPADTVSLEALIESFGPQLRREALKIELPAEDLSRGTG